MAMVEYSPDRVLALSPNIRWVGLANDNGEVIFSKMRPGVESVSPELEDREFMQLGPMMLTGVGERLETWAGSLEAVIVRYAEVTMIIRKFGGRHYLAVTIDSGDFEHLRETMESLEKIAK